jgi:RNA polymerase sigma-70 factor, ECF subfamily
MDKRIIPYAMSQHGTQTAFTDALDRHRGILFKVAGGYCSDRAQREDLVQDIVVQLWRAYGRFDGRSRFSTWMYRIALNVAISFYRRERRRAEHRADADAAVIEQVPAHEQQDDDRMSMIHEILEQLDDMNRALMLLYLDDLPYSEIATILGISETNVATKISRIKQRLKTIVTEQRQAQE